MLTYSTPAVTPSEADDYATARGYTAWTGDEAAKTAALRRGQDYIASVYNALWCEEFTDATAPDVVKFAIIEAAILEIGTPGFFSATYTPGERKVLTEVKGIKWQVIGGGDTASAYPISTRIEGLLSSVLCAPRIATAMVV